MRQCRGRGSTVIVQNHPQARRRDLRLTLTLDCRMSWHGVSRHRFIQVRDKAPNVLDNKLHRRVILLPNQAIGIRSNRVRLLGLRYFPTHDLENKTQVVVHYAEANEQHGPEPQMKSE